MTRREKLRQRIENNPKAVRFEDLETLFSAYDFVKTGSGSSHFKYQHPSGAIVVVAYRRPHLKAYAVRAALTAIEHAEAWEQDEQDS
ncbi:MAG: type II toxin-antitoxin system HicA family toxin [Anaerolineae bacterium]|nr:type II toxin-antitoxin system HicA family toxin [Anaerolineae bacterium]